MHTSTRTNSEISRTASKIDKILNRVFAIKREILESKKMAKAESTHVDGFIYIYYLFYFYFLVFAYFDLNKKILKCLSFSTVCVSPKKCCVLDYIVCLLCRFNVVLFITLFVCRLTWRYQRMWGSIDRLRKFSENERLMKAFIC